MNDIIYRLYQVLLERRQADPEQSYVASLYEKGIDKIAGKLSEETAETIVEAVRGDRGRITGESADLIFHLMVLWAHSGVTPEEVFAELERRFGAGGIEEKQKRNNTNPHLY